MLSARKIQLSSLLQRLTVGVCRKCKTIKISEIDLLIRELHSGDGLSYHNGSPFSTMDNDNDQEHFGRSCSATYGNGGWWYRDCYTSNLTGLFNGNAAARNGITWYFWRSNFNSIQDVVMRLRNGWGCKTLKLCWGQSSLSLTQKLEDHENKS